jgi:lipoate-protein ligase A
VEAVSIRLLPYAEADGPHNMAADEVLLHSALAGVASLRFYGWSRPTLSLGYFQPESLRHSDPRLAALPFVRRASGGRALVHHHELTYALALPAGAPWQTKESWLCRMHHILSGALKHLGVTALGCPPEGEQRLGDFLCFQHLTAGDLLIGSSKVVGSAQRRQRGALLQHGGILLSQSPYTPALPGIHELSGRQLFSRPEVVAQVVNEFHSQTGWSYRIDDLTASERQSIANLVETKYSQDSWNRKR